MRYIMHNLMKQIINNVECKLPSQGPLEYFVHHNTMGHYQSLDFFDATKKAAFDFKYSRFYGQIVLP